MSHQLFLHEYQIPRSANAPKIKAVYLRLATFLLQTSALTIPWRHPTAYKYVTRVNKTVMNCR